MKSECDSDALDQIWPLPRVDKETIIIIIKTKVNPCWKQDNAPEEILAKYNIPFILSIYFYYLELFLNYEIIVAT